MLKNSIKNAYDLALQRKWNKIYWAIDLHGVCFVSNYKANTYEFINERVIAGLRTIASLAESRIILWSSCYTDEQIKIIELFNNNGIRVDYFNANPEVENTTTGDFSNKFYFSILLDDKAGFDPEKDWETIINYEYPWLSTE